MVFKSIVVSIVSLCSFAIGFVFWGYAMVGPVILGTQYFLMSVTVWDVLSSLAPLLAPVVSLGLLLLGKIVWNLHQRIENNEVDLTKVKRTLYGDTDDAIQDGLTEGQADIRGLVEDLAQDVQDLSEKMDEQHQENME